MNNPSTILIYDILVSNQITTEYVFISVIRFLVFFCVIVFCVYKGWHSYNQVSTKSGFWFKCVIPSCIGVLIIGYQCVSLVHFVTGKCLNEYERWIEEKDYEVVEGFVKDIEKKRKLLASDSVPTFKVGSQIFEYGVSSDNFYIDTKEYGGILIEGLYVEILFRGSTIIKIYEIKSQNHVHDGVIHDAVALPVTDT